MQLWLVAHFFHFVITCGWVQQQSNSKPTQKWWQNEKKWATGQSCIRKEEASYKILTLTINTKKKVELIYCKYFSAAVIIFILDYENKHNWVT